MKRKRGFFSDPVKRRALIKFLGDVLPKHSKDGRIGLVIGEAFIAGYQKGYARAKRAERRGGE